MLRYRLLLGTIFVALMAALCLVDGLQLLGAPPGAWLFPLALLLSGLAAGELLWLFAAKDIRPNAAVVYAGTLAIVASTAAPLFWPRASDRIPLGLFGWPATAFILCTILALTSAMRRYERPSGRTIIEAAAAVFALAYVGWMMTFLVCLRAWGSAPQGMRALVSLLVIVKMADTGAYTFGRMFGRHKMAPVISPGKTWEGAAGAIVFAIGGAWLVFVLLPRLWKGEMPLVPAHCWIPYALILAIAGMIGDLAESLIKRDMGRKDSSPWMPGFGGMLDMIDSLLIAAPVAYLFWVTGCVY